TVETNYFPMPLHDNVWVWDSAVDFNIVTSLGDFPINQLMPGIPGTSFRSDNFGAWFNGYVAFTNAGYYRMQISSDDGFRLSQGLGITRQVLHLKGSGVDRDVAAVVTTTNNSNFGGSLPVVPISGPVAYFSATTPTVGTTVDLTGKIAAMNNTEFADRAYVQWAQDMGAIGAVLINDQTFGLPYLLGGSSVTKPIHIPVLCVNGFGGEEAMWATNANLVATIGADAQQQLGIADYGKGMSWIDCSVVVPQPGLYPLHLTYWQGGGGAGLEWATAYSDTLAWDDVRRVLVQDTATAGALNGYRALTVQPTPTIKVVKQGAGWTIQFTGTLLSSQTANGTYAPVAGATSPYTVPTGSGAAKFYRSAW
ncbi:MAG TPA: PA domain-containing protein, partial [Clostridia bacterium]|nr:PA domain-containing protein [Clostridia bacterium]